jgi:hypothetical protein
MTGRNIAASVRAKLLNKARADKRAFSLGSNAWIRAASRDARSALSSGSAQACMACWAALARKPERVMWCALA